MHIYTYIGTSDVDITTAQKRPLQRKDIEKGVGQFSDTPFKLLGHVNIDELEGNIFLQSAEIKIARRSAVEDLLSKRRAHDRDEGLLIGGESRDDIDVDFLDENWDIIENKQKEKEEIITNENSKGMTDLDQHSAEVSVLCRNPEQVTAACEIPWLNEICLDFLEVHGLREAVLQVKSAGKTCIVATPRILKPDEQKLWTFYLRLKADALLIRSAGFLQQMLDLGGAGTFLDKTNCTIPELHGDFSLNAANSIAANLFLDSGISRLSPTHDLNAAQIVELTSSKIEIPSGLA